MCKRHSFCLTKAGKVIDGLGLVDSHTSIMSLHGMASKQHDTCNLYEWQPPRGWPESSYADGLTVDKSVFETKARHEAAIERHLRRLYPTQAAWDAGDVIRWDDLPLPDVGRVRRAYDLAMRARTLAYVDDATVLEHVNMHLSMLPCSVRATSVVSVSSVRPSVRPSVRDSVRPSVRPSVRDSVWPSVWDSVRGSVRDSVRGSVWDSVWDSVWPSVLDSVWDSVWPSVRDSVRDSVWDSVWDSVRDSVDSAMVRDDDANPFIPLAEMAAHGAYLYGVTDDGIAYVWRTDDDKETS